MNLRLVLELKRLGRPMMVALNMADVARAQGLDIDVARLSGGARLPVVETVAVRRKGHAALLDLLERELATGHAPRPPRRCRRREPEALQAEVRRILEALCRADRQSHPPLPGTRASTPSRCIRCWVS